MLLPELTLPNVVHICIRSSLWVSSRKFPGLVPWMRDGLYGTTLPSPLDFCCSMLLAPRPRGFSSHRQSLVFQHHPGENTGRIRWKMRGTVWNDTVDGWNPVNSPVEVGSLSHYLQGFIHPRWLFGISSINSMYTHLSQLTCWSHQNGYCLGGGFNVSHLFLYRICIFRWTSRFFSGGRGG